GRTAGGSCPITRRSELLAAPLHYTDPDLGSHGPPRIAGRTWISLEVRLMGRLIWADGKPTEDFLPSPAQGGVSRVPEHGVVLSRPSDSTDLGPKRAERFHLDPTQVLETRAVASAHDAVERRVDPSRHRLAQEVTPLFRDALLGRAERVASPNAGEQHRAAVFETFRSQLTRRHSKREPPSRRES